MNFLTEPVVLMLLPAALVFLGMFTGFVLWSWARGIDNQSLEDIHDDIRRLGARIKQNSGQTGLLDLQFENEELKARCQEDADKQQVLQQELAELKSILQVHESENALAERTIRELREEVRDLEAASDHEQEQATYQFVPRSVFRPELAVTEDPEPQMEASLILQTPFLEQAPLLDADYGGQVRRDEHLGLVYTQSPMINDNLQLISGIASKLEQQLNSFGIFTFQQIMLWNEHNIDQFSNLLDTFQDRIQRDDWVAQATALYNKARSMRKAA